MMSSNASVDNLGQTKSIYSKLLWHLSVRWENKVCTTVQWVAAGGWAWQILSFF